MICPYCNNEIKDGIQKCNICGVDLKGYKKKLKTESNKMMNNVFITIFAIGYMFFGIALMVITIRCLMMYFILPVLGFTIMGLSFFLIGFYNFMKLFIDPTKLIYIERTSSILLSLGFSFFIISFFITFNYLMIRDIGSEGKIQAIIISGIFWIVVLSVYIFVIINSIKGYKNEKKE